MKLVEVVRSSPTSDEAFATGIALRRADRQARGRRRATRAGFIVNRLLVPYMLDAIRAFEEGVGSIEEIDDGDEGSARGTRWAR